MEIFFLVKYLCEKSKNFLWHFSDIFVMKKNFQNFCDKFFLCYLTKIFSVKNLYFYAYISFYINFIFWNFSTFICEKIWHKKNAKIFLWDFLWNFFETIFVIFCENFCDNFYNEKNFQNLCDKFFTQCILKKSSVKKFHTFSKYKSLLKNLVLKIFQN